MHSSNYYRHHSSPYKAPSKSANTYEVSSNRSRSNLHDIYDETWPLDEVIEKIDIKSDSEDDFNYHRNQQSWNSRPQYNSDSYSANKHASDTVYAAFPESSKPWNSTRHYDYSPKRTIPIERDNKWSKLSNDVNNNYLSDDGSSYQWSYLEDDLPTLRDVGIQCNLKKYKQAPFKHTLEAPLSQKPPIKVIKSSTNGFVSAYSDVPKLGSHPKSMESQYCALDFDGDSIEPNDAIYSQVDKSGKRNNPNNINIIYKQPLNESITSYRSLNDGKSYDVKSKEIGFNVNNSNAPRIGLPNPTVSYVEPPRLRSYNGSYRDLNEAMPVEKEIIEETISISNASTDESYRPTDKLGANRYPDNMSYTGQSVTSRTSSNYRRESPAKANYDRSSLSKQSPYGTLEKNRDTKSKLKKKKNSYKNDENVLLANNSLRLKSSKYPQSERLYKSNADLRDQFLKDETRGGLAAAYKNRQPQSQTSKQRALSLSRMNALGNEEEQLSGVPLRHLSQSHLNGTSSRLSDSGSSYHRASRHMQHERDPIVMYIPTVNHQRANAESPKLTSILRNNSTKSTATLPSKSKKAKEQKSQSKINLKEGSSKEKQEKADKKKADLNRRHSMPKDTKFNWFSKFKLKSNK